MWSKNDGDVLFHYFSENTYLCGLSRSKWFQSSPEIPLVYCEKCYQLSLSLPKYDKSAHQEDTPPMLSALTTDIKNRKAMLFSNSKATMPEREWEEEYLRLVLDTIAFHIEEKKQGQRSARQTRISDGYNENVYASWKMNEASRALEILQSMQDTPYFGRIDFTETRDTKTEAIYIGRSHLDYSTGDIFVYDWRAPIASMYYREGIGKASYRAPEGWITGEITARRQYEISNGKLVRFYDEGGEQAVDEMLLSMLKRNTSSKMRQIVQSIQAEQDKIVRSNGDIVVVQGPAGSGKTIIALHRAAYLLYNFRLKTAHLEQTYGQVSAQQMLVFSPNRIFEDYISRVLPDLHEDQIRSVILENEIQEDMNRLLRRHGTQTGFKVESKEDYYEFVLSSTALPEREQRTSGSLLKSSPFILDVFEAYSQKLNDEIAAAFTDFFTNELNNEKKVVERNVIISAVEMSRIFHRRRNEAGIADRLSDVLEEVKTRVKDQIKLPYIQIATVRQLRELLPQFEAQFRPFLLRNTIDLYLSLWKQAELFESTNAEEASVYPINSVAEHTREMLQRRQIAYEDILPLLLLDGYYHGFRRFAKVVHAVVDEAQDYSLLHYAYLQHCLPDKCKMTIVGDVNQALNPLLNLSSYNVLENIFPHRIELLELKRSYRSSLEITEFARHILPNAPSIDNVRRTGNKPKLIGTPNTEDTTTNILAALKQLSSEGYKQIAILCKTRKESIATYQRLRGKADITLLQSDTASFSQGVFVLPVYLAKGLEFDAVILDNADAENYNQKSERKFLYTACTRALHELYICYSGDPTPLLPLSNTDLYDLEQSVIAK